MRPCSTSPRPGPPRPRASPTSARAARAGWPSRSSCSSCWPLAGSAGPAWGDPWLAARSRRRGASSSRPGSSFAGLGLVGLRENLTAVPRPVEDGRLIDTGVYGLVRHPIYTGIILAAVGWGLVTASPPALLVAFGLGVFFDLKSRREEAWLLAAYPAYADYRQPRPQADPARLLTRRRSGGRRPGADGCRSVGRLRPSGLERSPAEAVHDRPPDPDRRHGLGHDPVEAGGVEVVERLEEARRNGHRIAVGREELQRRERAACGKGGLGPGGRRREEAQALTRPRPKAPARRRARTGPRSPGGRPGRSAPPDEPGASAALPGAPGTGTSSGPISASIASAARPPGRSRAARPSARSTTVDSTPTRHGPPSSTSRTRDPSPRTTWLARVGETRPNRLADGAAIGTSAARMRARATGWSGTRRPTVERPAVTIPGMCVALAEDDREGPGPEARGEPGHARVCRVRRVGVGAQLRGVGEVDDERIERGSFLGREDPGDRRRVEGMGSEPVDRLGREGHELARPDEGGRLADRGRVVRRGAPAAARRERVAAPSASRGPGSPRVTAGGGSGAASGRRRRGEAAGGPAGAGRRPRARPPARRSRGGRAPPGGRPPHRATGRS